LKSQFKAEERNIKAQMHELEKKHKHWFLHGMGVLTIAHLCSICRSDLIVFQ
jgi:hypothetical protein